MRLIDADELLSIEKLVSIGAKSPDAKVLMEQVLFDIQEIPTIDAVPVQHEESIGTSFIFVKDVDEYKDRIILDEWDKSKRCKVYYADAPAKHGQWDWLQYDENNPKNGNWHCSKCNLLSLNKSLYCPRCGARMDGEEK